MFQIKVSLCIKPNATPLLVMNDVIESGFRFAITHSSRFARESVVESHYWVLTIHWTQSDKTQITWCIIWAVVAIKPLNSVYNTTPRATLASLLTHFCTYIYIYIVHTITIESAEFVFVNMHGDEEIMWVVLLASSSSLSLLPVRSLIYFASSPLNILYIFFINKYYFLSVFNYKTFLN